MAMPPYERRSFRTAGAKVEARDVEGVARPRITGCAAVYNQISEDLGSDETGPIFEVVRPGAFDKALFAPTGPEADVRALLNHEPSDLLGRLKARTLSLWDDPAGLMYAIDPPDTQCARDLATSIGRGDLDGSSFGFIILRDRWSTTPEGHPLRELLEVHPFDVSPVTYPAYAGTARPDLAVALRSLQAHRRAEATPAPVLDPAAYLALFRFHTQGD